MKNCTVAELINNLQWKYLVTHCHRWFRKKNESIDTEKRIESAEGLKIMLSTAKDTIGSL